MTEPSQDELIYDWNAEPTPAERIQLDDETLRDGLQSPSARDPELSEKLELVHLMDQLGIDTANIGLPGASAKAREHILALCREMAGLAITPNVACRTLISDIAPAAEVQQQVGARSRCAPSSARARSASTRRTGSVDKMLKLSRARAVEFCVKNDLPCMFVTEDTTRARPDDVRALYTTAIEAGAKRICVCDTCGHATPSGSAAPGRASSRSIVDELGADVGHRLARPPRPRPGLDQRHWPPPKPAPRASTAPHWASASAPATPRWTCCWSTCSWLGWIDNGT